jgi:hypothetical protein
MGRKRKIQPPPPAPPDHPWHEPIRPDCYVADYRQREIEAAQERREAYLAKFRAPKIHE